jgi:hypothetical protein
MLHFDGKMAHYHDFATLSGKIDKVSENLQQRADDIHMLCGNLGARKVIDIGSYYGGILFLLEETKQYAQLTGLEKRRDFFDRSMAYKASINSKVNFLNIDFSMFSGEKHDVAVVQNVYHYLFGESGSHNAVFSKLYKLANNLVWYNPVSVEDHFLVKYMQKSPSVEWQSYNENEILMAARREGFLVNPDSHSRYSGMGSTRKHYIFSKAQ